MDKFAWITVDKAKIILLNDFSWQKEQIAWKDFLLLLEGHTVRLPTPKKTQYAKDGVLSRAQMMSPSLLLRTHFLRAHTITQTQRKIERLQLDERFLNFTMSLMRPNKSRFLPVGAALPS